MTAKRFEIVKSKLIKDGWVISDKIKQFTFPTLKGDKRALISYCKALNKLHEENKELKKENAQFDILIKNNQLAYIDLECENERLKSENNILRVTIGRNEAYIGRLTHQSEWSNEAKNMSISSRDVVKK